MSAEPSRLPTTLGGLLVEEELTPSERLTTLAPKRGPFLFAALLVAVSVAAAMFTSTGDGFKPRIATVDGLAGLVVGAFLVDRLLTFLPPTIRKTRTPEEREAGVAVLRWGWGSVFGAGFVLATGLGGAQALAGDSAGVSVGVDRAIAVLAIAGGVVGITGLVSALNPKPLTDTNLKPTPEDPTERAGTTADGKRTVPPPRPAAYGAGLAMVALAFGLAVLVAGGDKDGVNLVGVEKDADATTALVVRFGIVLLAAGIVQQAVAWIDRGCISAGYPVAESARGPLLGGIAVALGTVAAWAMDLYLLHNLGFFGVTTDLNVGLAASESIERDFDLFVTGVVVAAGTKPINDLAARLRKAKDKGQQATK